MKLNYLTVYRGILQNPVIRMMSDLLEKAPDEAGEEASRLVSLLVQQSEKYLLEGPVLEAWIWHRLLGDGNAFSLNCENGWTVGAAEQPLSGCAAGIFPFCGKLCGRRSPVCAGIIWNSLPSTMYGAPRSGRIRPPRSAGPRC